MRAELSERHNCRRYVWLGSARSAGLNARPICDPSSNTHCDTDVQVLLTLPWHHTEIVLAKALHHTAPGYKFDDSVVNLGIKWLMATSDTGGEVKRRDWSSSIRIEGMNSLLLTEKEAIHVTHIAPDSTDSRRNSSCGPRRLSPWQCFHTGA